MEESRGEERAKGRTLRRKRAGDTGVESSAGERQLNRLTAERSILWYYVACALTFLNGLFSLGKNNLISQAFMITGFPPPPFKNTPTKLNLLNLLGHKWEQAALSK